MFFEPILRNTQLLDKGSTIHMEDWSKMNKHT